MPQYLMSVWHDDDYSGVDFTSPEVQRTGAQVEAFNEELQQAGAWVFGWPPPRFIGNRRARRERRRVDDRWPICRDKGADGRLLDHRGGRLRRRARVGRQGGDCL